MARRTRAPFSKAAKVLATLGAALVLLSAGVCAVVGLGNYGVEGLIFLIPGILLLVLAAAAAVLARLIARGVLTQRGGRYAIVTALTLPLLAGVGSTVGVYQAPGSPDIGVWLLPVVGAIVLVLVAFAADKKGPRDAVRGIFVGIGLGVLVGLLAPFLFYAFVMVYQGISHTLGFS